MVVTATVVLACVATQPTAIWSAPLSFASPDAPQAQVIHPTEQEVAALGQSDEYTPKFSIEGGWAWQLRTDLDNSSDGRFTHDRGHVHHVLHCW